MLPCGDGLDLQRTRWTHKRRASSESEAAANRQISTPSPRQIYAAAWFDANEYFVFAHTVDAEEEEQESAAPAAVALHLVCEFGYDASN